MFSGLPVLPNTVAVCPSTVTANRYVEFGGTSSIVTLLPVTRVLYRLFAKYKLTVFDTLDDKLHETAKFTVVGNEREIAIRPTGRVLPGARGGAGFVFGSNTSSVISTTTSLLEALGPT